jgi:hypothetical protein
MIHVDRRLPTPSLPSHTRRRAWSRRRRWIAALSILLILGAALATWRVLVIKGELQRGAAELNLAVAALTTKPLTQLSTADFEEGQRHLQNAEGYIRTAHQELEPWGPVLGLIGGDAAAVLPLTDVGLHGAEGGQEFYDSMKPLLTMYFKAGGADSVGMPGTPGLPEVSKPPGEQRTLQEFITLLRQAQPGLRAAREELNTALSTYRLIDRGALSGEVAEMADKLDRHIPELTQLDDAASVLLDVPDLLTSLTGMDGPKSYLVLAQNNDELRPLGGFIGTFGLLTVQNGQIVDHEFGPTTDSPDLTAPTEPCPATSPSWWIQFKLPVWECWDSQWTGDFPTMAQQAKWFYDHGGNAHAPVDGIIALDQTGTEMLLNALGPVSVPDYNEVVTGSNLRARIYYYRLKGKESGQGSLHKEFLASVFQAIVEQNLVQLSAAHLSALWGALTEAVAGTHLLFYFTDPLLQKQVAQFGADGAIRPASGDYLYVMDTSLQEKVWYSINERIDYSAIINQDKSVTGQATLSWTYPLEAVATDPAISNQVQRGHATPWLLDLTRIYLPERSNWTSMNSHYPTYFESEAGKLLVGTRVDLQAGESKQVRYDYQVPSVVQQEGDHSVYTLLVQKQPGTKAFPLGVHVTLPLGAQPLSTTPTATVSGQGVLTVDFETTLAADTTFTIGFR